MKSNNNRRSAMLQTEYTIHLKEIKPWPPSQSLNSLRSVLIQWEYGPQFSGTTTLVIPTLGSVVGEGKIQFNQSFNISVALPRMMSIRSTSFKAFQKNCLELNLYEPRRDKVRGLLLGSAVIDFAEFGILEEVLSVNVVLNCKRNFRNICQPVVFIDIVPVKNGLLRSCSSIDRNVGDSVLALMSEEYAKEAAVKSVIDDDGSSHSSLTVSSSAFELNEDIITDEGSLDSGAATPVKVETCFAGVLNTKLKPVSNVEVLVDDNAGEKHTHFQEATESATKAQQDTTRFSSETDSSSEKNIYIGEFDDDEVTIVECSAASEPNNGEIDENDEKNTNAERTRLKQVKSMRSLSSFSKTHTSDRCYRFPEDATTRLRGGDRKELRFHSRGRNAITENRVEELEQRIKILEEELREAAAIEFALYSVVAEHGSSKTKVHTPARRLSRLYLRASEENSRANAAKSSVSGLVLVAKACGNDVPRLMYWLSNCVTLRSIITLATGYDELPLSTGLDNEETENSSSDLNMTDWSDPQTYTRALEKLESWIFCRIIESLWWQTLVPYMQCYEESFDHIHITSLMNSRFDESNFPVELWNEAFKEVSELLCPVRATMRECGCLPVLSRLVIEQCVARLDVSMFNAILRESADEVPTDPVSDPISDPRVLPVPVGKSSFGAGAQLKNAIGKWCRSIDELFDLNEHKSAEMERDNEDERQDTCTKFFYHLNTLSDLMMLPKDMLLDKSVRKEVCPTLGPQLIKRLLNFHVPDEFCTELVPVSLLDALENEDSDETRDECISHIPCSASPPVYNPPPAESLTYINGNSKTPELRNSGLLLIRKSYTSDDELSELQSPLSFVLMDGSGADSTRRSVTDDGGALRYRLLKEVWRSSR